MSRSIMALYWDIKMRENMASDMGRVRTYLLGSFNSIGIMLQASFTAHVLNRIVQFPVDLVRGMYDAGQAIAFAGSAFETMLGSAQASTKMVSDLRAFAAGMALSSADVMKFAQQLVASGVAAENVVPYLYRIVSAASVSTSSMSVMVERVARAITQIRTAPKLLAQEMRQLTEAGIPAWDMLAKGLGKTRQELNAMMRQGGPGISAGAAVNALMKGMMDKFGGNVEKRQSTFFGAVEAMKAMWENFMGSMGMAVGKRLDPVFARLMVFFKSPAASTWGGILQGALLGVVDVIVRLGEFARQVFSIFYEEGAKMFGVFFSDGMNKGSMGIRSLGQAFQDALNWVVAFLDKNRSIVQTIIAAATAMATFTTIAMTLTTVVSVVGYIGAAIITVQGAIAGAAALLNYWGTSWQTVFQYIATGFANLDLVWQIFLQTMKVGLAIVQNDWKIAWEAMFKFLWAAWQTMPQAVVSAFKVMAKTIHANLMLIIGLVTSTMALLADLAKGAIPSEEVAARFADTWATYLKRQFNLSGAAGKEIGEAFAKNMEIAFKKHPLSGFSDETKKEMAKLGELTDVFKRRLIPVGAGAGAGAGAGGFGPFKPPNLVLEDEVDPEGKAAKARKAREKKDKGFTTMGLAEFYRAIQDSMSVGTTLQLQKKMVQQLEEMKNAAAEEVRATIDGNMTLKDIETKLGFKP